MTPKLILKYLKECLLPKQLLDQTRYTNRNPIDIWYYIQGNIRYGLYYSKKWKWLLRGHIIEQIEYRLKTMNSFCYYSGACVECGCEVPKLQMASKRCNGVCYPTMMTEKKWQSFKEGRAVWDKGGVWMKYTGGFTILGKNKKISEIHRFYKEMMYGYVEQAHPNDEVKTIK